MKRALCVGILVAAAFAAPVTRAEAGEPACRADRVLLRGDWGTAAFRVEVADEPKERQQGLMFRTDLSAGAGMLFVFDETAPVSFWMENTVIPLDMVFLAEDGSVSHVHSMAKPLDRTAVPSMGPVRYVLEIKGGLAAAMGISRGTQMRHPAILQNRAIWPC